MEFARPLTFKSFALLLAALVLGFVAFWLLGFWLWTFWLLSFWLWAFWIWVSKNKNRQTAGGQRDAVPVDISDIRLRILAGIPFSFRESFKKEWALLEKRLSGAGKND